MIKCTSDKIENLRGKWSILLLLGSISLSFIVISKVAYTEIDWRAYMQEVEYVLDGERDYSIIKGDTGPLVYPGGFVWSFIALRTLTNDGLDIATGQYIFAGILGALLAIVLLIYNKVPNSVPTWALTLLVLSKRIQSIFVLRLFNDCIAVLLGYAAVYLFTRHNFRWGSIVYSLGVSIKMNLFLMAPGVLVVLWLGTGLLETLVCLSLCAGVQLAVGAPFLLEFPVSYISRAFEFSRVFKHEWTVNLKFLDEPTFVSKPVSLLLLLLTLAGFLFFARKFITENAALLKRDKFKWWNLDNKGLGENLQKDFIVTAVFLSNFIGVMFARTLHFQFYCWYFHTLPWLLWHAHLPTPVRLTCMIIIEVVFNVFPVTPWSSLGLQAAHTTMLVGLALAPAPQVTAARVSSRKKRS